MLGNVFAMRRVRSEEYDEIPTYKVLPCVTADA